MYLGEQQEFRQNLDKNALKKSLSLFSLVDDLKLFCFFKVVKEGFPRKPPGRFYDENGKLVLHELERGLISLLNNNHNVHIYN